MASAKADNIENVMSAPWRFTLDFMPKAKLTVVLDKIAFIRSLIEKKRLFCYSSALCQTSQNGDGDGRML